MTQHCGALVQGSYGLKESNFEMVIPAPNGEGLVHYSRDNDMRPERWGGPAGFGTGAVDGVALIQSDFGVEERNLEVVASEGGTLVHYWRDDPSFVWYRRMTPIARNVRGTPGFIQRPGRKHPDPRQPGRFTTEHANFEVVVPLAHGGLGHWWRDNGHPDLVWIGPVEFGGSAVFDAVALTQSNFVDGREPVPPLPGEPFRPRGNLEVVARQGERLFHFHRDEQTGTWSQPKPIDIPVAVTGVPMLIQSNLDAVGDFLLLVPMAGGGVTLWRRKNHDRDLPWTLIRDFSGGRMSIVGMVQSSFGTVGNVEFVVRNGRRLEHHWADCELDPWRWEPPSTVAIEHIHAESDGKYGWNAAYLQEGTHIIVPIELRPGPGIDGAALMVARERWRRGIQKAWNCGCRCETARGRSSEITFDVEWLPPGGGPPPHRPYDRVNNAPGHHVVCVVREADARATLDEWSVHMSGEVAAHEFGHLLGLADEYEEEQCIRDPVNTGTLMHVVDGHVEARMVEHLCAPMCSQTPSVRSMQPGARS